MSQNYPFEYLVMVLSLLPYKLIKKLNAAPLGKSIDWL